MVFHQFCVTRNAVNVAAWVCCNHVRPKKFFKGVQRYFAYLFQVVGDICVGVGKYFCVRRIFVQISPNVPDKCSKQNYLRKTDCISFYVWWIFSNQSTSSTIFARISPNLPRKNYLKMWPSKTNKRCLLYDFGAIFVKSEHVQRFCEGIHTFCPHFHRFFPAFTKSKVLGVHLHPRLLHQWLAMQGKWTYTKKKMSNVTAKLAWSVFHVRKLYTLHWVEWMFVLMSMDILRRS